MKGPKEIIRGFVLIVFYQRVAAFSEDVFKDGAKGLEVVQQTVDLIGQTCLLDNDFFLIRMANIETTYGTDGQTYRQGYNGGIWNIGQDLFDKTKNDPKLYVSYRAIKNNLNIDWSNVTWHDLRKPIYSGLAASLLLLSKNIRSIPESIEVQASIWGILRAGNQAFDFFSKSQSIRADCDPEKIIDVAIVLDFHNLSTPDLVHVISYLQALITKLPVQNDNTRVAIVTKKGQPIAGWYLNSSRPGFTLFNALKILRYTAGPTTAADSINYTREHMFTTANGARAGSARVAVLLTDGISKLESAKQEAKKLEGEGISLIVVAVIENITNTFNNRFSYIASVPSCRNTIQVDKIHKLNDSIDRLVRDVCSVPVLLKAGNYTYPCNRSIVAKLPDSTNSVSVMVSSQGGKVTLYGAKEYMNPSQSAHDVKLNSDTPDTSTGVLYVRGTDPIFIKVFQQPANNTCTGSFTVHVKQGKDLFEGRIGVCIVADTVSPCNDLQMGFTSHDVILLPGENLLDLCDPANSSLEFYPHPVDAHKFIMCDQHDTIFVGLCPIENLPCRQMGSGCTYSNPCANKGLLNGDMYHNDPCGNQSVYVTCTHFGIALRSTCSLGRIWNDDTSSCVFKDVRNNTAIGMTGIAGISNPCIHEHSDHVYFPYPGDIGKYIFCDSHGNAYARTCTTGHWNQQTKTCTEVKLPDIIG